MVDVNLLTLAKKVNNFIIDATDNGTGNDKFDSTTVQEWEVPANKRWFILGGAVNRDTSGSMTIKAFGANDKEMHTIDSQGAATGVSGWPNPTANAGTYGGGQLLVLDATEYIKLTFGAAQGAATYATCVVLEIDV